MSFLTNVISAIVIKLNYAQEERYPNFCLPLELRRRDTKINHILIKQQKMIIIEINRDLQITLSVKAAKFKREYRLFRNDRLVMGRGIAFCIRRALQYQIIHFETYVYLYNV